VDHEILKTDLTRKLKDEKVMKLISEMLCTYNSPPEYYEMFDGDTFFDFARPPGLPIGNFTSQLFAYYVLAGLDRLIKEKLKYKNIPGTWMTVFCFPTRRRRF
jgi:RNA-directed DNA polymerase